MIVGARCSFEFDEDDKTRGVNATIIGIAKLEMALIFSSSRALKVVQSNIVCNESIIFLQKYYILPRILYRLIEY